MVGDDGFIVSAATLFPNLSFVHNWPRSTPPAPSCRSSRCASGSRSSATETEVLSWFAVDREARSGSSASPYRAFLMRFGSSGMFEQDDVENSVSITTVSRGLMACRLELNSRMGRRRPMRRSTSRSPAFSGPGAARVGYSEFDQRRLATMWSSHLAGGPVQRVHPLGPRP